jgi:hypothetical protein
MLGAALPFACLPLAARAEPEAPTEDPDELPGPSGLLSLETRRRIFVKYEQRMREKGSLAKVLS